MLDEIAKQVAPVLLDSLVTLIAVALAMGIRWVNAHTKNAIVQGITKRLADTTETVVRETEQTMVKQIKEGGLLSPGQAKVVKEATLNSLKTYLGPKGIAELKKVFPKDELEAVLNARIEAAVHDLRASQGVILDTTVEVPRTSVSPPSVKVETKLGGAGLILLVVALLSSGCAVNGTFEEARSSASADHRNAITLGSAPPVRDQAHCESIDHRHEVMEFSAWMTGLAAGATGTVAGAIQGSDETTKNWRIGLGVSAGILGAAAATTAVFSATAATEWAHDCSIGDSK